jgi:ubiquinone/menaquinone biosynthesis C-methylase UbiE
MYVNSRSVILDVGGGKAADAGPFAMVAANVVEVEIDRTAIAEGRRITRLSGLQERIDFVAASATALPFRNRVFDIVTCFSVLDHLHTKESVKVATREFYRVVRTAGHVAITFPNKAFLPGTISMLARRITDKDWYWEQRFTPKEFHGFLLEANLLPIMYDYGTATRLGPGLRKYNIPGFMRAFPYWLTDSLFMLVMQITNRILSSNGMRIFGPRFGILSNPIDRA